MPKKMQSFNDGVVSIYAVSDTSLDGGMPAEALTHKRTLRYYERTVGLTRFYTAKQTNVNVKYVLRCPLLRDVSAQDVAIPNDGKQYRIVQVQFPEDVDPSVMDLTLEELLQDYDIVEGGGGAGDA
jgi:SPP1 family predicted phage head-tail adaptor